MLIGGLPRSGIREPACTQPVDSALAAEPSRYSSLAMPRPIHQVYNNWSRGVYATEYPLKDSLHLELGLRAQRVKYHTYVHLYNDWSILHFNKENALIFFDTLEWMFDALERLEKGKEYRASKELTDSIAIEGRMRLDSDEWKLYVVDYVHGGSCIEFNKRQVQELARLKALLQARLDFLEEVSYKIVAEERRFVNTMALMVEVNVEEYYNNIKSLSHHSKELYMKEVEKLSEGEKILPLELLAYQESHISQQIMLEAQFLEREKIEAVRMMQNL
ncbi:Phytanoyl-CoA dioxygenase domain-containing protein 1 [Frankliniella fusca]|uniref:Phytanoyl-CoA dioxygenase domain-containing protein 1 n=1 Tax=Frankliniella fusca TaxID=407009 RepID=A0AAE1HYA1_9NEOP|nr:Phytanoyl-CoA dioxygenase domain-containing protein 1 [Frankliniella fusca]KAK3928212.1 Phytanoyl-CoA dioxygenase domain-containing protein 1 [Frankliniella fusca]KAK3929789.1 Phytanoyl-CoA dioxygenase domain-containing protein 1 [Frankliniella fusca]